MSKMQTNIMKEIRIEKLTLNIGAGKDQTLLEKGVKLLKSMTGMAPIKTVTNKRIPTWGLRPGLPIGCKVTLRGKKATELLKRLLESKANKLKESQFDDYGNMAFGIPEYIDIPNVKYDPEIGVIGLEACVTLERPGFRVKKRKICKGKIAKDHQIKKEDAMNFMKKNFSIKIGDEE
ncbi:MAG: 50S ribosomal protein L5 [Candidatus Woesearchaeota archaeon]|nr:50S ribosomal protein L5 [Candidatus Woesearchaeota archaeon]